MLYIELKSERKKKEQQFILFSLFNENELFVC